MTCMAYLSRARVGLRTMAEADGNRTRRRVRHTPHGFEGRGRHQPTNTSARTVRQSSADLYKMFAAGDELADDRRARNFACHKQTARRLGICEQQSLKFIDFRKI